MQAEAFDDALDLLAAGFASEKLHESLGLDAGQLLERLFVDSAAGDFGLMLREACLSHPIVEGGLGLGNRLPLLEDPFSQRRSRNHVLAHLPHRFLRCAWRGKLPPRRRRALESRR